MPSLSACLIVRDEEALLPGCLESIRGAVDELIVVDTGSTDRTVEIALSFGAAVHFFAWCDDFAAARNYAIDQATSDWILTIDADERIDPITIPVLRTALDRDDVTGYWMMTVADDLLRYWTPRIFRNKPDIRYEGVLHEMPNMSTGLWETIPVTIQHVGYAPDVLVSKDKYHRNLRLLEKERERTPDDPFPYYNRASVLASLGRFKEAEESAIEAIDRWLRNKRDTGYVGQMFGVLCHALSYQGRIEDALRVAQRGLRYCHDPELLYELGVTYTRLDRYQEALPAFFAAREMARKALSGEVMIAAFDPAMATYRSDGAIALAAFRLGRLDMAAFHAKRAIDAGDRREQAQEILRLAQDECAPVPTS